MRKDPFTLRVALDNHFGARGELYLDDGITFANEQGNYVWREFVAEKGKGKTVRISSRDKAAAQGALVSYNPKNEYAKSIDGVRVEKIVVLGLVGKPTSVTLGNGKVLEWEFVPGVAAAETKEGKASVLVIKDPRVNVVEDWEIVVKV